MKKSLHAITAFILVLAMLISANVVNGFTLSAEETLCSLRVKTETDGMELSLYRIAYLKNEKTDVCELFKDFSGELDGIFAEKNRKKLAQELNNFICDNSAKAQDVRITDKNGEAVFSSLEQGIYFISSAKLTKNGYTYILHPFVIRLPDYDSQSGELILDVSASPKTDKEKIRENETASYSVIKVWDDANSEKLRPESVTVQLRQDGNVFAEAVLNDGNNWTYSWDSLPSGFEWTLTENTVTGYESAVEKNGSVFVVTNTATDTGNTKKTEKSDTPTDKLAKTGQLWWPVPVLFALGLLFIIAGLFIGRRNRYE